MTLNATLTPVKEFEKGHPQIKIVAGKCRLGPKLFSTKLIGGQFETVYYVYFADPSGLIARRQATDITPCEERAYVKKVKSEFTKVFTGPEQECLSWLLVAIRNTALMADAWRQPFYTDWSMYGPWSYVRSTVQPTEAGTASPPYLMSWSFQQRLRWVVEAGAPRVPQGRDAWPARSVCMCSRRDGICRDSSLTPRFSPQARPMGSAGRRVFG